MGRGLLNGAAGYLTNCLSSAMYQFSSHASEYGWLKENPENVILQGIQ